VSNDSLLPMHTSVNRFAVPRVARSMARLASRFDRLRTIGRHVVRVRYFKRHATNLMSVMYIRRDSISEIPQREFRLSFNFVI